MAPWLHGCIVKRQCALVGMNAGPPNNANRERSVKPRRCRDGIRVKAGMVVPPRMLFASNSAAKIVREFVGRPDLAWKIEGTKAIGASRGEASKPRAFQRLGRLLTTMTGRTESQAHSIDLPELLPKYPFFRAEKHPLRTIARIARVVQRAPGGRAP